MVEIGVVYEGELRCKATHGPSGNSLLTDAPADNHGRAETFSPTDLVATALGTCMLTIMGIVAARREWDLTGTKVTVVKEMATAPVRRIGRLRVTIALNRRFEPSDLAVLEKAAHNCPVHKSLHPDIDIPVEFVQPTGA